MSIFFICVVLMYFIIIFLFHFTINLRPECMSKCQKIPIQLSLGFAMSHHGTLLILKISKTIESKRKYKIKKIRKYSRHFTHHYIAPLSNNMAH